MKAATLYQPYASLAAVCAKPHETRSWGTKHRGEIAIHAGKKTLRQSIYKPIEHKVNWNISPHIAENLSTADTNIFFGYDKTAAIGVMRFINEVCKAVKLKSVGPNCPTGRLIELLDWELPFGAVVATAKLVECWKVIEHTPTAIILKQSNGIGEDKIPIDAPYLMFGDYSVGRYIWGFADMKPLPAPVPAKGMQGLWNWEG